MCKTIKHLRVRKSGYSSKSITVPYDFDVDIGDLVIWIEEEDYVKLKIVRADTIEKIAMQEPVEAA
jgi:hypothetical protein